MQIWCNSFSCEWLSFVTQAGLLMTYIGTKAAIILILAWNIIAWVPELALLRLAHSVSSALRYALHLFWYPILYTGRPGKGMPAQIWWESRLSCTSQISFFPEMALNTLQSMLAMLSDVLWKGALLARDLAISVAVGQSSGLVMQAGDTRERAEDLQIFLQPWRYCKPWVRQTFLTAYDAKCHLLWRWMRFSLCIAGHLSFQQAKRPI